MDKNGLKYCLSQVTQLSLFQQAPNATKWVAVMDNGPLLFSNVHPIAQLTNTFLLTCHWKNNCAACLD